MQLQLRFYFKYVLYAVPVFKNSYVLINVSRSTQRFSRSIQRSHPFV